MLSDVTLLQTCTTGEAAASENGNYGYPRATVGPFRIGTPDRTAEKTTITFLTKMSNTRSHHPHLDRGFEIGGDQARRTGMTCLEIIK